MGMKNSKYFILTSLVVLGCLCIGFSLARHRALWNDEYYSQSTSVEKTSFTDQFLGHIGEGGNAPLFYALQKSFLKLVHYQTPAPWLDGKFSSDPLSQIMLRINPIIFMSLAAGLIFYYFSKKYSWLVGFYSLWIYLSCYMVWGYWVQARPYALIVFLTTAQSVILLNKIDQKPRSNADNSWVFLSLVNILLSLSFILSLGEIVAVSVLWWILGERQIRRYVAITVIPTALALFYYIQAPKYQFFFGSLSPEQLIRDNIARQYFDFLFLFIILLGSYFVGQWWKRKEILGKEILEPIYYCLFMVLVLAWAAVILGIFGLKAKPDQGFPITSRYFIYLTPIGVMATTIFSVSMIKSLSAYRPVQYFFMALSGGLIAQHFFKILPNATRILFHP